MSVAAEKILSHPGILYLKLILTTCLMCRERKKTDKACLSSRAKCMAFGRLAILTVGLISFPGMMVVSRHATWNFGRYNMPDPQNREGAQVCCRSHMETIQADLLDFFRESKRCDEGSGPRVLWYPVERKADVALQYNGEKREHAGQQS
jgi:hypothetical protein